MHNGCTFVRHGKGDYDIYYSPITNSNVTVDNKIKSRHMANEIMKQSGIKYCALIGLKDKFLGKKANKS